MNKLLLGLGAVFVSFSLAVAEDLPFDDIDVNNDGMISLEEFDVLKDFDFEAADKNDDGSIDEEEYSQIND